MPARASTITSDEAGRGWRLLSLRCDFAVTSLLHRHDNATRYPCFLSTTTTPSGPALALLLSRHTYTMELLDLPDELLEKTFDEVRRAKEGSRAIHSMLTVCRRTSVSLAVASLSSASLIVMVKRTAEKTMLYSVQIKTLQQLELFACKIACRPMTYDSPAGGPGRHVRDFCVLGEPRIVFQVKPLDLTPWTDPITSLLTALPLLRCFRLDAVFMTRDVILSLITGHLKSLTLQITFDHDISVDVLRHVGQLKSLEHLHITYDGCVDDEGVDETFTNFDALVLPNVKQFAWSSDFIGDAEADYVGSCRFHEACNVFLSLEYDCDDDLSTILAPFFAAHSLASVTLNTSDNIIAYLASQLVAVDDVKLTLVVPPLELLEQGRLPSRLKIVIDLFFDIHDGDEQDDPHFWEFLRAMPSFSERGSRVTELSILTEVNLAAPFKTLGREFRWSGETEPRYSRFVKQLIPEATRLYKEGVVIVDEKGQKVMQLT
jgi:hypothetical protein